MAASHCLNDCKSQGTFWSSSCYYYWELDGAKCPDLDNTHLCKCGKDDYGINTGLMDESATCGKMCTKCTENPLDPFSPGATCSKSNDNDDTWRVDGNGCCKDCDQVKVNEYINYAADKCLDDFCAAQRDQESCEVDVSWSPGGDDSYTCANTCKWDKEPTDKIGYCANNGSDSEYSLTGEKCSDKDKLSNMEGTEFTFFDNGCYQVVIGGTATMDEYHNEDCDDGEFCCTAENYDSSLLIGTSSDYPSDSSENHTESFTNGQSSDCPDGIARSATLTYEVDIALTDIVGTVTQDNCVYGITISSPFTTQDAYCKNGYEYSKDCYLDEEACKRMKGFKATEKHSSHPQGCFKLITNNHIYYNDDTESTEPCPTVDQITGGAERVCIKNAVGGFCEPSGICTSVEGLCTADNPTTSARECTAD